MVEVGAAPPKQHYFDISPVSLRQVSWEQDQAISQSKQQGESMSYHRRRPRRGRAKNGFGAAVTDIIGIANALGPKGTLIAGLTGFALFYFFLPWAVTAWTEYNKARMTSQNAALIGKLVDELLIRRFIQPAEWAGIAILVACALLACWKAVTRNDLDRENQHQLSGLAKLFARFLD